jgi:DNA-binding transcriptional ArsR family regulator
MRESKAEIILHPVRIRIIQTLAGKEGLTVQQMREALPDVPQASLYRHIKKLTDGGFMSIVDETPIRGTVEKTYALAESNEQVTGDEWRTMTKEEHMDYFLRFMALVVGDFERYVSQENFDFEKDGAGYRQVTLFLSDEEFMDFTQKMGKLMMEFLPHAPSTKRRARTLTSILTSEVKRNDNGNEPH